MSAALQLPLVWGSGCVVADHALREGVIPVEPKVKKPVRRAEPKPESEPGRQLAFYRKHTENLLRRYLYASMQVGRAPSILSDPVARGWASSRPVRTFEDAVIFVLDVEMCLNRLDPLDRQMLSRVVLQDYTHSEVAVMVGMSLRSFSTRLASALDRLTAKLLESGVLVLPE